MGILRRMRRAVHNGRYEITRHATEEMSRDFLLDVDALRIIETGQVSRTFTDDPRGTRYEVLGRTTDGRRGLIVARFLPDGTMRVVTSYVPESEVL
jgi:hypothetical protein